LAAVLPNALNYSKELLQRIVREGDTVVDATAGNGHDTALLARLVGKKGRVYAFDIQTEALMQTRERLKQQGLSAQVTLIHDGHENMAAYLQQPVGAIVFNLGYLPGGSHDLVTRPETTVAAMAAGLQQLRPGGVMLLVIYTGHPGGVAERDAVINYAAALDQKLFDVLHYQFINQKNMPPSLLIIAKKQ